MKDGRIVVGVDPRGPLAPVEWAYREAARRDAHLDLVHAWDPPVLLSPLDVAAETYDPARFEAEAKRELDRAVTSVAPDLRRSVPDVDLIAPDGGISRQLLDVSKGADLLVLGSRGRGLVRGLLGSVSHQCVHHARCPVTVIPPTWKSSRPPRRIVTGIDGSDGSAAALRWAIEEASLWDVPLAVVHSWYTPYPVEPWGMVVTPKDRDIFLEQSRSLIDKMVDEAITNGAPSPPKVVPMTIEDAAGPALVNASETADLLVVGSRGRGGFGALLLGSTSLHCLHHAACPVTVVRAVEF
jgi:nucleotide-binding universal stress UspA family protein